MPASRGGPGLRAGDRADVVLHRRHRSRDSHRWGRWRRCRRWHLDPAAGLRARQLAERWLRGRRHALHRHHSRWIAEEDRLRYLDPYHLSFFLWYERLPYDFLPELADCSSQAGEPAVNVVMVRELIDLAAPAPRALDRPRGRAITGLRTYLSVGAPTAAGDRFDVLGAADQHLHRRDRALRGGLGGRHAVETHRSSGGTWASRDRATITHVYTVASAYTSGHTGLDGRPGPAAGSTSPSRRARPGHHGRGVTRCSRSAQTDPRPGGGPPCSQVAFVAAASRWASRTPAAIAASSTVTTNSRPLRRSMRSPSPRRTTTAVAPGTWRSPHPP